MCVRIHQSLSSVVPCTACGSNYRSQKVAAYSWQKMVGSLATIYSVWQPTDQRAMNNGPNTSQKSPRANPYESWQPKGGWSLSLSLHMYIYIYNGYRRRGFSLSKGDAFWKASPFGRGVNPMTPTPQKQKKKIRRRPWHRPAQAKWGAIRQAPSKNSGRSEVLNFTSALHLFRTQEVAQIQKKMTSKPILLDKIDLKVPHQPTWNRRLPGMVAMAKNGPNTYLREKQKAGCALGS